MTILRKKEHSYGRMLLKVAAALFAACVVISGCASAPKADGAKEAAPAGDASAAGEQTAAPVAKKALSSGMKLFDGFETAGSWIAVGKNWGDGDTSKAVAQSAAWAGEGHSSLELSFNAMVKDKGATCFTEMMDITDFSPYEAIVFDVNNPTGSPMQVAVAITTGDGWAWFESNVFDIPAGESKDLSVPLYEDTLKAASTNWEYKTSLLDPDDVRRVAFKFFGPEGLAGSVFLDNIRLSK